MESYLVLEKGLVEERRFLLKERLTVGRGAKNDICPSDPTVSRQHALVYLSQGNVVVEDLKSVNGTFVNGQRVQKTIITSGDTVRFGDVVFRFLQEETASHVTHLADTQTVAQAGISVISEDIWSPAQGRRITEAITKVPSLSNLEEDDLREVSEAACPIISDIGQTIIQEGERGKFLYIVLEGSVRAITHDQHGKEVELGHFSEGQVFGEISLLTGSPCTATVQAIEKSLLCQLSFEGMREVLDKRPVIKAQLEVYCRGQRLEMEAKKREAGVANRRREARFNVILPVSFAIAQTTYRVYRKFQWKIFSSFSEDLSLSGVRIKVQYQDLLTLPVGCPLQIEISLPHPWGTIQCKGALRHKEKPMEGKSFGFFGVQFTSLSRAMRDKLEMFLLGH